MRLTVRQLRQMIQRQYTNCACLEGVYSDWMNTAGWCTGGAGISMAHGGGREDSTMSRSQHLGSPEDQEDAIDKEYEDAKLVQPGSLAWEREQEELAELRKLVRMMISEGAGAPATSPHAMWRNALSPMHADREQIGKLGDPDHDEDTEDNTEISSHLREPLQGEDLTSLYGPVPPKNADLIAAYQDPYTRDSSPLPTSRMGTAS